MDALRPLERVPAGRPLSWANMIASVDGRAAAGGTTRALSGPVDLELLLELRAAADAVLVGPGTLRAEPYGRLVRSPERRARRVARGLEEEPLAVVIARSGALPWDARVFDEGQRVVVYTEARIEGPAEVVRLPDASPGPVLRDLRERFGVRVLASEGGPRLLGGLLRAGCLDELFLTLSPQLSGDDAAPRIVTAGTLTALDLLTVHRHGSELFLRYRAPATR